MNRLSRAGWLLAVAILFGLAGCARAPRFETAVCPPLVAGHLPAGPDYSIVALGDTEARPAAGASDGGKYSRYASRHLLPGAGPSGGAGGHAAFLEWLFDEDAPPLGIEPYVEYVMNMSLADVVKVALTSVRIPLGRNTTAELSIGLMPAGGLALPGTETGDPPDGEEPDEPPEEERLGDIFAQIESVFVGLDVPLPGRVRSRLAVEFSYGWEAEVDPDAPEIAPVNWTLNVRYRAWFW